MEEVVGSAAGGVLTSSLVVGLALSPLAADLRGAMLEGSQDRCAEVQNRQRLAIGSA